MLYGSLYPGIKNSNNKHNAELQRKPPPSYECFAIMTNPHFTQKTILKLTQLAHKHGPHMGPIWTTIWDKYEHMKLLLLSYGGHTVFVHLLYMVPMWVAHCPYGSQILHTVSTYLAHSSTHMGPIQFLSTCFIWVPSGLPICSMGLMCGANMGPRSCPHFPQIMPIFLPLRAPYGFCPPVS